MTLAWMTAALEELVSCESPSADAAATRRCGSVLAAMVRDRLDATPELVEVGGRTHLRFTWGTPQVLVLGHLDTVWPLGTLARWPFSVEGDVATGPGAFDMKAGVVQALAALSTLPSLDGIRLLLTVDEEIGSPTSAGLVVDSARGCAAALVCEPSAAGALKTARKGIAMYELLVAGRAAHAGLEPEKGANAGVALAHLVIAASRMADAKIGTTVTPTVLSAGTTTNTVPAAARLALDVRAAVPAELPRVESALHQAARAAGIAVPGTTVEVTGGVNRPPLDASSSAQLFARAGEIAAELGMPALRGVSVGGGSDGNFTAGAGVPTLDGLGAVGDGAHAEGEHVLLSTMEPRARLLAGLLVALR
ncbi:MAG TPA: M20/M25/M40 family metallo-hydrolase [Mycobacteriales bacterium]|nr:M20/M25/M40 family metallo-hydrolase [Mycobacteriales bacterium]